MDIYTFIFAVLGTIALIIYIIDSLKMKKTGGLVPLVASFLIGLAIMVALNEVFNETTTYFILNFAVLFSILPFYYIRNSGKLLAFLILIFAEFFYVTYAYGSVLYPFIQMLAIGTGIGLIYRNGSEIFKRGSRKIDKGIETRRDYVHIALGIVIIALFLALPFYYAVYATTALIMLGYLYNSLLGNLGKGRKAYGILSSLERPNALYGEGALYLAVGVALLVGFIHNLHFVIIGISALLFADPLATIIGLNLKGPKLFYNKKKSVYGTLAFLVVVTIMGYPFIGIYALFFGVGLALVESVKFPIDDNIMIAVVMIILYIIFLTYVGKLPF